MLTKLRTLSSLYKELGFRWSTFRVAYALRLRTGLIRLQTPQYKWDDRPLETWLKKDIPSNLESYALWRKNNLPKFFFDILLAGRVAEGVSRPSKLPASLSWYPQTAIEEADRILNGGIKYFAHQFHQTGFPPKWHQVPATLLEAASFALASPKGEPPGTAAQAAWNKHWSQISDDSDVDIKFIWEPNRFAFVYTFVRAYAASYDEKYAEAFWNLVLDWAKHNPPNTGANWKDGQEIALRLMAWIFGYYAFFNFPSSTPQRIAQFTQYVAAQAERIYKNIDYAISTKSNHTISEAFGLWLVGLLFPELKDSEKYFSLGRKLLEQEAATQIFSDGSYSMYSINYHRFILHIYLYAIRLADINHVPFSSQLKSSVANSVDYLSHLIDPETGQMPVYGSNDGALVLPFNNCDFTDYRPLLQLGWYMTKKEFLFEPGEWDEDFFWIYSESFTARNAKPTKENLNLRALGESRGESFPDGGVYLLRNTNSKALIRCTDFHARPSHADQLHVDLWIHGYNIACDAGTYLYTGKGIWRNGLAHTSAHNTVTVDGKDQMTMISRFTWTNWSKGKVLKHDENLWQGEHGGYKPVPHTRTVMILEGDRWLVIDDLVAAEHHKYSLHWLFNDAPFTENKNAIHLNYESRTYKVQTGLLNGEGKFTILRADPISTRGWRSRYYGHKEPAISLLLEAHQSNARFWTFFGFEKDKLELHSHGLQINGVEIDFNQIGY